MTSRSALRRIAVLNGEPAPVFDTTEPPAALSGPAAGTPGPLSGAVRGETPAVSGPPGPSAAGSSPIADGDGPAQGLGGEEFRAAVRKVRSEQAKAARNRRGRQRAKPGYQPGSNRRFPG